MHEYNEEEKKWIHWLYHVPGLGRKRLGVILSSEIDLVKMCGESSKIIEVDLRQRCGFSEAVAGRLSEKIVEWRGKITVNELWDEMQSKRIKLLLPQDAMYPVRLKEIPDAPAVLYMRGEAENATAFSAKTPVVAVIGSRECSEYGKYVARQLGKRCAQLGIALVSGLARGVDGLSQEAALHENGKVAAVLGCGADVCYPEGNRKVYDEIVRSGCVFSEYLPGTEPKSNYFPPRNRIISGIADALIVVEAKEKSGTLITVDMALEQGREVYVVPGRITDPMSRGCNRLLRQGASIVCGVDEALRGIAQIGLHNPVLEKVFPDDCKVAQSPYPEGSLRHAIRRVLDLQPKSVQQIYEEVAGGMQEECWTITELQAELFYMQMEGVVSESEGRFTVRNGQY